MRGAKLAARPQRVFGPNRRAFAVPGRLEVGRRGQPGVAYTARGHELQLLDTSVNASSGSAMGNRAARRVFAIS